MNEFSFVSAFLIGIAGSVHCIGMCGSIVGAFTFAIPKSKSPTPFLFAYNTGRIISYTIAGAITGLLGQLFSLKVAGGIQFLTLIGGIFLLLLGLYIGEWWRILTRLESAGAVLWKYIRPISKRFIPFPSPIYAVGYGLIWGWLPCGLVYSTLTWSVASGSMINGALLMLSFGLGTLPAMIALGFSGNSIKKWVAIAWVRKAVALMLIIYALLLIGSALHNIYR